MKKEPLSTTHPSLAKQWHPTKNGRLTPNDVTSGSEKKVWWKCPKGDDHEWEALLFNRSRGRDCPYCRGLKVSSTNSLATLFPELAKEWHPTKNGDVTPNDVVAGSGKKYWWKCSKGDDHEWEAPLKARIVSSGCPFERGLRVSATNSLSSLYPELAKEWHPTKNGNLTPNDVTAGSAKKCWWKCPKGDDHEWEAPPAIRKKGIGCPFDSGHRVSSTNSLATLFPELAKEWHPTKNGDVTPNDVVAGSGKKYWWKCPKGDDHEWEATLDKRTRGEGRGCPFDSGHKVSSTNSLATLFPELAKEWHPTKNGEVTASDVTANSGKDYWWKCPKGDDHEWETSPNQRVTGRGCSRCNSGWTQDNIRHFVRSLLDQDLLHSLTPAELFLLAQQAGLVALNSNRSEFVKALISGRLDPEELEEFAQGGDNSQLTKLFNELSAEDHLESPSNATTDTEADPEVSIQNGDIESDDSLPDTTPGSILDALESELWSTADKEAVEFLISSGIAKLWRIAYNPERLDEVKKDTATPRKSEYAEKVRTQFRDELEAAESLVVPSGYNFRIKNKLTQPNLMQRHLAVLVRERRRVGNWSGTGAGKTLSAVLASRVIDASLTVILCPNAVVGKKGWASTIRDVFPSSVIVTKSLSPDWPSAKGPRYLILNYETLQQPTSEPDLANFLRSHRIDMVVIDEIHYAKQRTDEASKRRRLTEALCSIAAEENPELAVLGMSATPVINTLREGVSMVNLVTGVRHSDLETASTLSNCMKLHQRLVSIGLRWMPPYPKFGEHNPNVDVSHLVDDIRALPKGSSGLLRLEQMLIEAKLDCILEHIEDGTLIYTEYVEGIVRPLTDALTAAGWKVGHYTGQDKSGFEPFCKGDLNVLIGSSAVGTGVDGLQHRANKLIIACAPWTAAAYEQLIGRLVRQGQMRQVNVIFPITSADVSGEEWSWCQSRLNRIRYKKTIADAAVDGIIPLGHLRSPAQAYQDALGWLQRLDSGHVTEIMRPRIVVPLSDAPVEVEKRIVQYGDFSTMNNRWNSTASSKLHARLHDDPTEWANYHTLYRESRKDWVVVPFERIGEWIIQLPKNRIVADFGCGEDILGQRLRKKGYTVHSFDHVSISNDVVACDIGDGVPLNENDIDVAIFSLSLMGANCGDYLREAARTLVFDGRLIICEPTKRLPDDDAIRERLSKLGFHVTDIMQEDRFTFIRAVRTDNEPNLEVTLF